MSYGGLYENMIEPFFSYLIVWIKLLYVVFFFLIWYNTGAIQLNSTKTCISRQGCAYFALHKTFSYYYVVVSQRSEMVCIFAGTVSLEAVPFLFAKKSSKVAMCAD